jgi:hypothetical protein
VSGGLGLTSGLVRDLGLRVGIDQTLLEYRYQARTEIKVGGGNARPPQSCAVTVRIVGVGKRV